MRSVRDTQTVKILGSLLIALAMLTIPFSAQVALAHPPQQEGEQPGFVSATYVSPDGDSTIQSQEAELQADFMAANGSLEGVIATQTGITLAEGQLSGVYISDVIHSPLSATTDIVPTWGADLPADAQLRLETRLSLDGGDWSDWVENPEAFYPVRDDQHGGSLIWVGGGQADLQFRITLQRASAGDSPALRGLTLVFSNTDEGPTAADISSQMDTSAAAANVCPVPMPPFVPRVMWGCPDGPISPRRPPTYAPVTHVIIHHTATPNNPYQDWAQVVRSVWNYHANTLWWGDVGYNFLIDPNGVIYEGRAGGNDVVGIHDTFNRGSMAIGFIGCYGNCGYLGLPDAQPSPPMLDSGVNMMAWKMGQKGIDPTSISVYDGAGVVPVIAGGRDVVATFSPGDYLYARLPWFREATAQRVNCQGNTCRIPEVIFDKDGYAPGDTIHLTATVVDHQGMPVSGAAVFAVLTEIAGAESVLPAPFELVEVDPVGHYQGGFSGTGIAGRYRFEISASDPTGQRFAPCITSASVGVGIAPPPGNTVVVVEPEHLVASWCSFEESTAISVKNVSQLRTVSLEVLYDPAVVQVVDADPSQWGVQVRLDGGFLSHPSTVALNEVDTDNGRIYFEASTMGTETINGDAGLIIIDWRPQMPGITDIILAIAVLTADGGTPIPHTRQGGTVEILPNCVSGVVVLQGRSDHSGAAVTAASGAQATTDAGGSFTVDGGEPITVSRAGYLTAVASPGTAALHASTSSPDTTAASVGTITLLAGDLNQDNLINVFDLAIIASHLDTDDTLSDLNADGVVNILDIALIAGNFGQQGPQTDWQ
jgi:hypothetical protein